MPQVLVISDGKPGHLNQSLAFATLRGLEPVQLQVRFRNRVCRLLSYLLDRIGFYPRVLLAPFAVPSGSFVAVVAAGSQTYYAARLLGRALGVPTVAVLLPSGYRFAGFDLILAPEHDDPPPRANLLPLPINLCHVQPKGLYAPGTGKSSVGIVLGGANRDFVMEVAALRVQLAEVFARFPSSEVVVATSRRTPVEVEQLLADFPFAARWIYSRDPANPIPDFIARCNYVFISSDSTSMISEAVSFGTAAVEVLPLPRRRQAMGKFDRLVERLAARGCLHRFDGTVANCRDKIDLAALLRGVL